MYKKFLDKLLAAATSSDSNSISIDEYLYGYANTIADKKDFDKRIIPIILKCSYTPSNDTNLFFEHLITTLIERKYLLSKPKTFKLILKKTNMIFFFKELLTSSICENFSIYPFDNYYNLNEKQQRVFVTFLRQCHISKDLIMMHLLLNYEMNTNLEFIESSFLNYDEDIMINFVTDCSIFPEKPLIHNLAYKDTITFEYEGNIFNKSMNLSSMSDTTIIEMFKKFIPDYFGVIRVWKGLKPCFTQNRIPQIISFDELLSCEDMYELCYEIDDSSLFPD